MNETVSKHRATWPIVITEHPYTHSQALTTMCASSQRQRHHVCSLSVITSYPQSICVYLLNSFSIIDAHVMSSSVCVSLLWISAFIFAHLICLSSLTHTIVQSTICLLHLIIASKRESTHQTTQSKSNTRTTCFISISLCAVACSLIRSFMHFRSFIHSIMYSFIMYIDASLSG